jgi:heme-degrading monooxygenase HmoA
MTTVSFVAAFLYEVEPAGAQAFEAAYGSDGTWTRFFAGGDGYAGTELWRASEGRYLVLDRWTSEAAYEAFVDAHADEYRRRSAAAERLYFSELVLGRFQRVTQS